MSQTGALSLWELGTLNRSQLILLENATDPTFFGWRISSMFQLVNLYSQMVNLSL
jgi:hypothetical protein